MYSDKITAKYIIEQQKVTPSFKAEYHSIADCEAMIGILADAWDPQERVYTRRLLDEEISWIENERLLCTHDFMYYATRYAKIVTFEKILATFQPNIAQKIVLDIWSDTEAKRWAIMMIQLKSRQLGVSTLTELAVAHRVQFWADVDAVIASSTPNKTEKLSKMIRTVWDHMPWWLMPRTTKVYNLMPAEFGGHNSAIDVSQSGNQFSGVSRGSTPNVFHGSELCEWSNPIEDIDASLLNAIHETPFVFVILESTALGRDNWWHKKWRLSKEGSALGRSRLEPLFLPWYCLAPSTPLILSDGRLTTISEVQPGDVIVTHTGKEAEVKRTILTPRRNEVTCDLWLWGNSIPLSCTRDHRVWTPHGWKPANSISSGDFVVYPIRTITDTLKSFQLTHIPHGKTSKHPHDQKFPLNFEWGRLIGLYLAEGTIGRNKKQGKSYPASISIACHKKEVERFISYIQAAIQEESPAHGRKNGNGVEIRLSYSSLARWIETHFGYTDSKRIPNWVWTSGREFCRGLFVGYCEGDGNVFSSQSEEIAARSVRLQLTAQMRDLVASLGYGWSSITWFPAQENGKSSRGGWWLHVRNSTAVAARTECGWPCQESDRSQHRPLHWRFTDDRSGIAIEVERNVDGFSESFYDLEVDDPDHSFTTIQCAVHNCGRDIYPDDGWLLKHPVPFGWQPDDELGRYIKRCESYVQTNTRLKTVLGQHWTMPKEQAWWYDVTKGEYEKAGNLNRFLQEVCADDFEAFQSTNYSAFPVQVIQECRSRIKDPVGVYKLRGLGPSVEDITEERLPMASEIDSSKPPIDIPIEWGQYRGHFQLVPVKFEGYSASSEMGKILIYEHPRDEFLYGYGADTAEGIGLDRTVNQVVRKDTLLEPDAQVCEFASDFISGLEFWPWCMAIGSYYSTRWEGERKQAKAAIEVRGSGDALQYELRKRGWANFLVWPRVLDNKKIDFKRMSKLGFVTNPWSRPIALEIVLTWIKRNRILINSPYLVEEMESLEKDEDKQSMRAEFGAHDDRIMALAFILFAFHLHEIQSAKATVADQRESLQAGDDPEYDPGPQGRDMGGPAAYTMEHLFQSMPSRRR